MNKLSKTGIGILSFLCLMTIFIWQGCSNQADNQSGVVTGHGKTDVQPFYNNDVFQALSFRNIGPYRGGRSLAVAGTAGDPTTFYAGFTGGGVYKTVDAGKSWFNVSDGYFKTGSVGAITVSPSDPNVVYAGMGETDIRGEISFGDGVYKSTDAGKTWQWVGLGKTQAIGQIAIHPANPDIVYVAAMGRIYGKKGNKERGIFKTTDGGKTWDKVLYKGLHLGGDYVEIDPNNPKVVYTSLWKAYRMPWKLSSGGNNGIDESSGLYKSTDGGETWDLISDNPGFAKSELGKMEVVVSPADPNRLYALVEADDGGLYRSDDAGKTWQLVHDKKGMTRRAWYFIHLQAGPADPNTIYAEVGPLRKSTDGGKTFHNIDLPHWDAHDMWIDPNNPDQMIVGDDGGAQVSLDGGETWTSYYRYSTAQVYKVSTDDRFPYHVYGAQIDNTALVMKNRTSGAGITRKDWLPIEYSKTERGYLTPETFKNPSDPFKGGDKGRIFQLVKYKSMRNITNITPENTANDEDGQPYRIQSSYPIYTFHYKPNAVFATSQYVLVSHDLGHTWKRISPDLTRNEKGKRRPPEASLNYSRTYNSISSLSVSPVDTDVLWAGADDGLIHVSKDNGKTWTNVTPSALKAFKDRARINHISTSPFEAGAVYVAAFRYEQGDFEPLLFKTKDYGQTWAKITNGIRPSDFTHSILPDKKRKGLLFAGTETGLYISFNNGEKWQRFQLNLPNVPVTDMTISRRDNDLVIATKGRGFYILDDLNVLEELSGKITESKMHLFKPAPAYQLGEKVSDIEKKRGGVTGQNPTRGPNIYYYLNGVDEKAKIQLQFLKGDNTIQTYLLKKSKQGLNKFTWDMLDKDGREAAPATYTVQLLVNDRPVMKRSFEVRADPRTMTVTH